MALLAPEAPLKLFSFAFLFSTILPTLGFSESHKQYDKEILNRHGRPAFETRCELTKGQKEIFAAVEKAYRRAEEPKRDDFSMVFAITMQRYKCAKDDLGSLLGVLREEAKVKKAFQYDIDYLESAITSGKAFQLGLPCFTYFKSKKQGSLPGYYDIRESALGNYVVTFFPKADVISVTKDDERKVWKVTVAPQPDPTETEIARWHKFTQDRNWAFRHEYLGEVLGNFAGRKPYDPPIRGASLTSGNTTEDPAPRKYQKDGRDYYAFEVPADQKTVTVYFQFNAVALAAGKLDDENPPFMKAWAAEIDLEKASK